VKGQLTISSLLRLPDPLEPRGIDAGIVTAAFPDPRVLSFDRRVKADAEALGNA